MRVFSHPHAINQARHAEQFTPNQFLTNKNANNYEPDTDSRWDEPLTQITPPHLNNLTSYRKRWIPSL